MNYGTDLALGAGFAKHFPLATQTENVLNALFRRWTTDPQGTAGALAYGGKCIDLRRYFAGKIDPGTASAIASDMNRVAQHDERVSSVAVQVVFQPVQKRLKITAAVTFNDQTQATLIMGITSVTAEVLNGAA